MGVINCPNINTVKELILPTKEWLEPLEKLLIENDKNTRGKIYVADLLKRGNIIVKISNYNPRKKAINDNLYNCPNIVNTYCTFDCNEDLLLIDKNKQFCNNTKNSRKYTLELMEKYFKSLTSRKLSVNIYKDALLQLVFSQINIFSKYGYTHNDIHSGNILTKVTKNKKTYKYKYFYPSYFKSNKKYYEHETNIEFILTDFDDIVIITEEYLKNNAFGIINRESLYRNITQTITTLNENIKNDKIRKNMTSIYKKYYLNLDENNDKIHKKIVNKNIDDIKTYRIEIINLVEKFVYDYYILIKDVF
jgi:hypothetical protein